jgi:hypothetical protein
MKTKIVLGAMGLSLFFFCGWLDGSAYSLTGPSISISPEDYDAGDLTKAPDLVNIAFQVFNKGDALLSIPKIKYT